MGLIAGAGLALGGCNRDSQAKGGAREPQAVPVTVAPVTVQPATRSIEIVGSLFGDEDVTITNKVPGRIIHVYKDVGDVAEPGEPLAQLLRNDYELDLRQKESALNEVLSKLGLESSQAPGLADFDVETLPAVRRARLQAENARSKYERGKVLFESDPPALTPEQFADARTTWDVAQAEYEAERLTARELLSQVRTRQVEVAIAQQALNDTTIRAPRLEYAGVNLPAWGSTTRPSGAVLTPVQPTTRPIGRSYRVASRFTSEGELLAPVTRMFRLVDADPVKFRGNVPERFLGLLRVGQDVLVKVEAYPQTFTGKLTRINPQIDPTTRTVQIEAIVPNEDLKLAPGSFARASVQTHEDPKVVYVPGSAVVSFAGVNRVFLVNDQKASERIVELGPRREKLVEITKGLTGSEQVIVTGAQSLSNGSPVTLQSGPTTRTAQK